MSNSQQTPCPFHDGQFISLIRKNIRSEGKMKMCSKCFFDEENLQKKDVIIIDEFDTKIANLGSSLETIQHTSLQQLEILNDINQEKDRLGQAIVEMGQKKQSLDNFIKTSQSSFQLGSVNLSDNQVSDFMELFNQQELLRNINLELQRSLDPLRDLRTFLKQQREKILQDIQLINQILNGKLSIQSENLHQQQQVNEPNSLELLCIFESCLFKSGNESSLTESYEQIIQQSSESFQSFSLISQKQSIPQLENQQHQTITINLVFDHLLKTYEVDADPVAFIGDLAKEFKLLLNHTKEIYFLYEGNILEEKRSFQQLNIQNGYTLQGQLQY
ncbi:unnamed protein product [Paramecium octaurelia]|uniref:Ubiquitin-like domain-containing protein n=1 Tax=Paramecium octaurelia TaxID=43137 RepID=A0A8S1TMU2_PAROT|nr:unnamed protein product [Paramecium octaurelia]